MAAQAVAREAVVSLRREIARIEGRLAERLTAPGAENDDALPPQRAGGRRQPVLATGVDAFDAALGGGLPLAGLTELHSAATRDGGATAGFALALSRLVAARSDRPGAPLLWIGTAEIFNEAGRPYAPGIAHRFGLAPEHLVIATAARLIDVLWIAEEATNAGVFSSVLVELRGSPSALDLTATRRLHRRSLIADHPLFLIRQAGHAQPTAAPLRLSVAAAPASKRRTLSGLLTGSIGPPAFHIAVDKSRTSLAASLTLEWTHDAFQERSDAPHSGAMVSAPSGGACATPALRTVVAFPRAQSERALGVQPPGPQYATHRRA